MKFTIELEDFWMEEEDDLSDALNSYVTREVVSQISKNIKDKVESQLTKKIQETINAKLEVMIDVHLGNLIEAGVIVRNGKEISMVEHMKKVFKEDHSWQSVDKKIREYSKNFAKEMIIQYDAAFANKIVENMKTQGLLKDEVVQILLEGK